MSSKHINNASIQTLELIVHSEQSSGYWDNYKLERQLCWAFVPQKRGLGLTLKSLQFSPRNSSKSLEVDNPDRQRLNFMEILH